MLILLSNEKWDQTARFWVISTVLKAQIKGLLTGYTVAMVTSGVKKITTICLPMFGYLFDTIITITITITITFVILTHQSTKS